LHAELGDKRGMAVAFNNLSTVAFVQSEFSRARSLQENSLDLRREIGDARGVAYATAILGWLDVVQGNYEKAAALLESAQAKLRELGDNMIMGFCLWIRVQMALDQGDFDRAAKILEENAVLVKDREPQVLWQLALVKQHAGDLRQAQELLQESLAKFRGWGYKWGIANTFYHLGRLYCIAGGGVYDNGGNDNEAATACFHESMLLNRDLGNKLGMAKTLVGFGSVALAKGDLERSASLFAAAEALHQTIGAPMTAYERIRCDREVSRVRALLEEKIFATIWNAGKNMTAEQAVRYALQERSGTKNLTVLG
jgi:tetratricopeptide (TPR) repeat protein